MSRSLLVVAGGGAAGFFCAVNAARLHPGREVVLLEKSQKLLSKVKVSGGGRCNLTHDCANANEMSQAYPRGRHFVKKVLHRFFATDTVQWFTERGVAIKTEADGRMFPVSDSSASIMECLMQEANRCGIKIMMNAEVVKAVTDGKSWTIRLKDNRVLEADNFCIACGGYPRSDMFQWLRETGHTIVEPVPSLFTFNIPQHPLKELMGISIPHAKVKVTGTSLEETGPVLITHWGLSGPAVLRLSARGARELHDMKYSCRVLVNWLPEYNEQSLQDAFRLYRIQEAKQVMQGRNPFDFPKRFWDQLLQMAGVKDGTRWADLTAVSQNKLVKSICAFEFAVNGKTTFKEEFVTAGGIDLAEVDPQTMMSKKHKGLFFAGEILDVDGITGGYNFQFAWSSGWIAANSLVSQAAG